MEHLVAFMLLVGCNADASTCSEIPAPTPSYSSLADCEADLPLQMRLTSTYDARVYGACETLDEAMMESDGTIEWAVNRRGELKVAFVADDSTLVAEAQPEALEGEPEEAVRVASR